MPNWSSLVASSRAAREQGVTGEIEVRADFLIHFPALSEVLHEYSSWLLNPSFDDSAKSISRFRSHTRSSSPEDTKSQILEVRRALRFALSCLSFGKEDDNVSATGSIRHVVQEEAVGVCGLHKCLACLLSLDGTDPKCRLAAAKLLCNIVTANHNTAIIVAEDIDLSPNESSKQTCILRRLSGDSFHEKSIALAESVNWVDMISATARAGERSSVSALIAALHNFLSSFDAGTDSGRTRTKYSDLAMSIASDKTLMSNLVRNMLPVAAVNHMDIQEHHGIRSGDTDTYACCSEKGVSDEATEWICLVLEKLGSKGLLPEMYEALGGTRAEESVSIESGELVTPEHVVLLHCIGQAVNEAMHPSSGGRSCSSDPLGRNDETYLKNILFLAKKAEILGKSANGGNEEKYQGERECMRSAYMCILEMMATSVAVDYGGNGDQRNCSRARIGRDSGLFAALLRDLGKIVDELTEATRGSKAKELSMTDEEQQLITVFVRLIGNLCFGCKSNQDLLRTTEVPFIDSQITSKNDVKCLNEESRLQDSGQDMSTHVRTGLHVLLSCTAFSHGCFTLREWAVVAIRNALDGNHLNQNIVQQLEGQKAFNSPELQKMGFQAGLGADDQVTVEHHRSKSNATK